MHHQRYVSRVGLAACIATNSCNALSLPTSHTCFLQGWAAGGFAGPQLSPSTTTPGASRLLAPHHSSPPSSSGTVVVHNSSAGSTPVLVPGVAGVGQQLPGSYAGPSRWGWNAAPTPHAGHGTVSAGAARRGPPGAAHAGSPAAITPSPLGTRTGAAGAAQGAQHQGSAAAVAAAVAGQLRPGHRRAPSYDTALGFSSHQPHQQPPPQQQQQGGAGQRQSGNAPAPALSAALPSRTSSPPGTDAATGAVPSSPWRSRLAVGTSSTHGGLDSTPVPAPAPAPAPSFSVLAARSASVGSSGGRLALSGGPGGPASGGLGGSASGGLGGSPSGGLGSPRVSMAGGGAALDWRGSELDLPLMRGEASPQRLSRRTDGRCTTPLYRGSFAPLGRPYAIAAHCLRGPCAAPTLPPSLCCRRRHARWILILFSLPHSPQTKAATGGQGEAAAAVTALCPMPH